jgi:ribosome-associated translation inhibitor RaiA
MLADDIDDQVRRGKRRMEESESAIADPEEETRQMPSAGVMLGVGMAIVGLGVLGWMIYRSRRRQTFIKQLTEALPVSIDELRDELGSRLQRVRSRYSR